MTARATFTQAQIERAIRAATKLGKVAVQTQMGIAFGIVRFWTFVAQKHKM